MAWEFKNIVIETNTKTTILTDTTFIDENIKDQIWLDLKSEYVKCSSPLVAACLSITNSILTHRRIVFGMSVKKLADMVRNDLNLPERYRKFDNSKFKTIRFICFKAGLFVTDAKAGHYLKFSVVHPDILAYLNVDAVTQTAEFDENEQKCLAKGRTPKYAETNETEDDSFDEDPTVKVPGSVLKNNKATAEEQKSVVKKDYKSMSVEELLKH